MRTRPAIPSHASTLPRPPHPAPNVRDDRDTPLEWGETAREMEVIWPDCEPEYFCKGDWTAQISRRSDSDKSLQRCVERLRSIRVEILTVTRPSLTLLNDFHDLQLFYFGEKKK
jgi:hypothetical protein